MRENDLFFDDVDWEDEKNEYIPKYIIFGWNYAKKEISVTTGYSINALKENLIFRKTEDRQQVLDNCAEDLEIFLKD